VTADPAETKTASVPYSEFVKEQLEAQVARRKWLEERGLGVVTTSAALTGLLFGLVALVTGAEGFAIPTESVLPLALAVLVFLIASLLGLLTNWPRWYPSVTSKGLTDLTAPGVWDATEGEGQRSVTRARATITNRSRRINSQKAWLLIGALFAQFAGVLLIAVVVWQVLADL
jgi:hypothetical protein